MQVVNCLRSSSCCCCCCCCSVAQLCPTLCNPTDCSTPGFPVLRHLPCPSPYPSSLSFTISWSLLKLISIKLMMPSNHLVLCTVRLNTQLITRLSLTLKARVHSAVWNLECLLENQFPLVYTVIERWSSKEVCPLPSSSTVQGGPITSLNPDCLICKRIPKTSSVFSVFMALLTTTRPIHVLFCCHHWVCYQEALCMNTEKFDTQLNNLWSYWSILCLVASLFASQSWYLFHANAFRWILFKETLRKL